MPKASIAEAAHLPTGSCKSYLLFAVYCLMDLSDEILSLDTTDLLSIPIPDRHKIIRSFLLADDEHIRRLHLLSVADLGIHSVS